MTVLLGKIYTKMRNIIVKYLALSYRVVLFKKWGAQPRAASIIFPTFLTFAHFTLNDGTYLGSDSSLYTWVFFALTVLVIGITFFYFRFRPVKWEELDIEQKWFFGNGVLSRKTRATWDDSQKQEWKQINREFLNTLKISYRNLILSIIPLLSVIIFLVINI